MKKIPDFAKLIPVGSLLIILCSSLKLIIYYKVFNIDIVDYLDVQEYITLFIDDLFSYLLIFGFGILINIRKGNSIINKEDVPDTNYFGIKLIIGLLMLTFLGLYVLWEVYQTKTSLPFTTLGFVITTLILVIILFIIFSIKKLKVSYAVFMGALLFIYLMMSSCRNAFRIIENKDNLNYTIVLDNKTINTNDTLHFIGKSNNYVFLHNIKRRSSTIIDRNEIKEITIEPKKTVSNTN